MNRNEIKLLVLKHHRTRLADCHTYEAFRDIQLKFLDYLIESSEAEVTAELAAQKYFGDT